MKDLEDLRLDLGVLGLMQLTINMKRTATRRWYPDSILRPVVELMPLAYRMGLDPCPSTPNSEPGDDADLTKVPADSDHRCPL